MSESLVIEAVRKSGHRRLHGRGGVPRVHVGREQLVADRDALDPRETPRRSSSRSGRAARSTSSRRTATKATGPRSSAGSRRPGSCSRGTSSSARPSRPRSRSASCPTAPARAWSSSTAVGRRSPRAPRRSATNYDTGWDQVLGFYVDRAGCAKARPRRAPRAARAGAARGEAPGGGAARRARPPPPARPSVHQRIAVTPSAFSCSQVWRGRGSNGRVRTRKYTSVWPSQRTLEVEHVRPRPDERTELDALEPGFLGELAAGGLLVRLARLEAAADSGPDRRHAREVESHEEHPLVVVDQDDARRRA